MQGCSVAKIGPASYFAQSREVHHHLLPLLELCRVQGPATLLHTLSRQTNEWGEPATSYKSTGSFSQITASKSRL